MASGRKPAGESLPTVDITQGEVMVEDVVISHFGPIVRLRFFVVDGQGDDRHREIVCRLAIPAPNLRDIATKLLAEGTSCGCQKCAGVEQMN